MPGLLLGEVFPDFEAETTIGRIKFHEFLGDSWGILFSHPKDYTPVCTTELGRAARLSYEFSKRDVKLMAISLDSLEDHFGWSKVASALFRAVRNVQNSMLENASTDAWLHTGEQFFRTRLSCPTAQG